MEEKKDHRKTSFRGFLKYREDNLTGREKNEFERELQKDPFAAEAEEGFSELPADELGRDMEVLSKRLARRTARSSARTFYRIAAAIVLLLGISAIFILVTRSPAKPLPVTSGQVALNAEKVHEEQAVKSEEAKKDLVIPSPREKVEKQSGGAAPASKPIVVNTGEMKQKKQVETVQDTFRNEIIEPKQDLALAVAEKAEEPVAPPMNRSFSVQKKNREIRGRIISSDDKSPLPGVSVTIKGTKIGTLTDYDGNYHLEAPEKKGELLVASYIGMENKVVPLKGDSVVNFSLEPTVAGLSEVVVTGYSSRKAAGAGRDQNEGADEETAVPPGPVNGKNAFDNYIRINIRKPAEFVAGEKEVVVLSFIVRADGTIDSISVVRSPGKPFSDEAIRLLREGPAWKAATENGKAVEKTARVRIVFK